MGGVLGDKLRDDTNIVSIPFDRYLDLISWKKSVPKRGGGVEWVLRTSDDGDVNTIRNTLKKNYADEGYFPKFYSMRSDEYDELRAEMMLVPIHIMVLNGFQYFNDELRDEPQPVVDDDANYVSIPIDDYLDLVSWKKSVTIHLFGDEKWFFRTSDDGDINKIRNMIKQSYTDEGDFGKFFSMRSDKYDDFRAGMMFVPKRIIMQDGFQYFDDTYKSCFNIYLPRY